MTGSIEREDLNRIGQDGSGRRGARAAIRCERHGRCQAWIVRFARKCFLYGDDISQWNDECNDQGTGAGEEGGVAARDVQPAVG